MVIALFLGFLGLFLLTTTPTLILVILLSGPPERPSRAVYRGPHRTRRSCDAPGSASR